MSVYISLACLVISVVSFGLFLYFVLRGRKPKDPGAFGRAVPHSEVGDFAKLAEALAKLVDSVEKAGPATLCFVASIVFMLMSLVAARG